jgi:hypothetical protein
MLPSLGSGDLNNLKQSVYQNYCQIKACLTWASHLVNW